MTQAEAKTTGRAQEGKTTQANERGQKSQGGEAGQASGGGETHNGQRQTDAEEGQVRFEHVGEGGRRGQPKGREAGWLEEERGMTSWARDAGNGGRHAAR